VTGDIAGHARSKAATHHPAGHEPHPSAHVLPLWRRPMPKSGCATYPCPTMQRCPHSPRKARTESAGSRMVTACLQPAQCDCGKSTAGNGGGQRKLEINGLRVLVVEDSQFLAELIEDM